MTDQKKFGRKQKREEEERGEKEKILGRGAGRAYHVFSSSGLRLCL